MLTNNRITNMTEEEIDNLSYEDQELYSTFLSHIESYSESIENVSSSYDNAHRKQNQKNSMSCASSKNIHLKVYLESIGSFFLFSILSIYYLVEYRAFDITQSFVNMVIFSLYCLFVVSIIILPYFILPKKGGLCE